MNNQNLLIYEFNELFKLLDEIKKGNKYKYNQNL